MARKKTKKTSVEERIENSVERSIETPIEEAIETPIEQSIETPIEEKQIYVIAEGCSITSKRGILGAGDEVKKGDIPKMSFDKFIKIGQIVKR